MHAIVRIVCAAMLLISIGCCIDEEKVLQKELARIEAGIHSRDLAKTRVGIRRMRACEGVGDLQAMCSFKVSVSERGEVDISYSIKCMADLKTLAEGVIKELIDVQTGDVRTSLMLMTLGANCVYESVEIESNLREKCRKVRIEYGGQDCYFQYAYRVGDLEGRTPVNMSQ